MRRSHRACFRGDMVGFAKAKAAGTNIWNGKTAEPSIFSKITPKIAKQMGLRGWTKELYMKPLMILLQQDLQQIEQQEMQPQHFFKKAVHTLLKIM